MKKEINEDYVSFEVAEMLQEKGFDIECFTAYHNGGLIDYTLFGFTDGVLLPAPTLQMAKKWLREVHHLYIQVMLDSWACGGHMGYYIVIQNTTSDFEIMLQDFVDDVFYGTYEQACEAAIKYCLEELIKNNV